MIWESAVFPWHLVLPLVSETYRSLPPHESHHFQRCHMHAIYSRYGFLYFGNATFFYVFIFHKLTLFSCLLSYTSFLQQVAIQQIKFSLSLKYHNKRNKRNSMPCTISRGDAYFTTLRTNSFTTYENDPLFLTLSFYFLDSKQWKRTWVNEEIEKMSFGGINPVHSHPFWFLGQEIVN